MDFERSQTSWPLKVLFWQIGTENPMPRSYSLRQEKEQGNVVDCTYAAWWHESFFQGEMTARFTSLGVGKRCKLPVSLVCRITVECTVLKSALGITLRSMAETRLDDIS